jgi:hypothetical protein
MEQGWERSQARLGLSAEDIGREGKGRKSAMASVLWCLVTSHFQPDAVLPAFGHHISTPTSTRPAACVSVVADLHRRSEQN